jgi:hypothetical protein
MSKLSCEFVKEIADGTVKISSQDKEEFIYQYREALEQTKGIVGVVYIFRSESQIPRLKGHSNILYVGETNRDAWSRYTVKNDANAYWHVYNHILNDYGFITIDVYVTSDHKRTEKKFLNQYFQEHKELSPINRKG